MRSGREKEGDEKEEKEKEEEEEEKEAEQEQGEEEEEGKRGRRGRNGRRGKRGREKAKASGKDKKARRGGEAESVFKKGPFWRSEPGGRHAGFPGGPDEKDVVGLEREKEGGAGFVLAEGDEAGPVWAGGGGHDEEGLGGLGEFGEAKGDGVVVRAWDQLQRQGSVGK